MKKTLITGKAPVLPELKYCACHECINRGDCMVLIERIYNALNIVGVTDAVITLRECRRFIKGKGGEGEEILRDALREIGYN